MVALINCPGEPFEQCGCQRHTGREMTPAGETSATNRMAQRLVDDFLGGSR